MPTFDPSDLIGRPFLLPPEENGERQRTKVTTQVVEIFDQDNGQRVENINFILNIGNAKVEELISYNQLLEHLENAQDHDMGIDQELYRFRAIIGHQGPLLASDQDWKGSKYNVQVEWETGEITFEPLSIIAADDPVTCAAYAKENDLLALEGWRRFRSLAKKDKVPAGAIKQSKIRQVRRSQTYMFGYLIPRNYMAPEVCFLTHCPCQMSFDLLFIPFRLLLHPFFVFVISFLLNLILFLGLGLVFILLVQVVCQDELF